MASKKQIADVKRLGQIASLMEAALAEFDKLARPTRADQPVLHYLLQQARDQAVNAYRKEYVGVFGSLPDRY